MNYLKTFRLNHQKIWGWGRYGLRSISSQPLLLPPSSNPPPLLLSPSSMSENYKLYEKFKTEFTKKFSLGSQFRNGLMVTIAIITTLGGVIYVFKDKLGDIISTQTSQITQKSLADDNVRQQVNILSSDCIIQLTQDPVIKTELTNLVVSVLLQDECKQALIQSLFHDEHVRQELIVFLQSVVNDPVIKNSVANSASESLKMAITPTWMSSTKPKL